MKRAGAIRELVQAEPLTTLRIHGHEGTAVAGRYDQLMTLVREGSKTMPGAFEHARHLVRLVLPPNTVDQTLARERGERLVSTIPQRHQRRTLLRDRVFEQMTSAGISNIVIDLGDFLIQIPALLGFRLQDRPFFLKLGNARPREDDLSVRLERRLGALDAP